MVVAPIRENPLIETAIKISQFEFKRAKNKERG